MSNPSALLGYNATDKITGLKGVITAVAEFLYGPERIGITPVKLSKGEPVESIWLDRPRLKLGKMHTKVGVLPLTVKLGERVKDTVTGFKGIATGRYVFLNGCIRIDVTPEELKEGKPIEHVVFDEQRHRQARSMNRIVSIWFWSYAIAVFVWVGLTVWVRL